MACQCLSNTKSERHQKCIDKLLANFDVNVKYDSIFSKFENKNRHRIVCFVPTQYEKRARDPCRLIFITRCFPITHSWLIVVTSAVNHTGFCKSTATIVVNIYGMLPMSWQSTKWLINFCNLIRIVAALSVREPVIIRMKCKMDPPKSLFEIRNSCPAVQSFTSFIIFPRNETRFKLYTVIDVEKGKL